MLTTTSTPRAPNVRSKAMNKLLVRDYMSANPHTIGQEQSLATAHRMMRENHVRHLPVLQGGVLVGLLSQRDLYLVETLKDVDPADVTVAEAMTEAPMTVAPTDSLQAVVEEMSEKKYGSAVVMEAGKVVGIFTTIDALKALADVLPKR